MLGRWAVKMVVPSYELELVPVSSSMDNIRLVANGCPYFPPNCRNGYGSVCKHKNASSVTLFSFSFVVAISYRFTCFRAHIIKSETRKLTRRQLTEVFWI